MNVFFQCFIHYWNSIRLYVRRVLQECLWNKKQRNLDCRNEGGCFTPRGGNSKRVRMHWKSLKIFSRTSGPISIKLGTNHSWVKEILNCSNKGPGPLQRGDNYKNTKLGWGHLKISVEILNAASVLILKLNFVKTKKGLKPLCTFSYWWIRI